MNRRWDIPPDGDPGGGTSTAGNFFDGSFRGRTIPEWMDPTGVGGELTVLQLQPVEPAKLPENPGIVCVSVTSCCGKIEGAFPEHKGNSYVLKVRKKEQVQQLKELKKLTDGTPVSIKEHPIHNFVKFVVHCRAVVNLSDQAVMDLLSGQGIVELRRITKKGNGEERINTPMLILTIAGNIVPQYVYLGFLRVETRRYYPSPMQCFKCWDFGHTKTRCSKKDVCGTCSGEHVIVRGVFCHLPAKCYKCGSEEHPVSSRRCPLYVTENEIAKLRVDNGMSYDAAKKHYELQRSHAAQKANKEAESNKKFEDFAKMMEDRLNKQNEELVAQRKEWERRFEEQQMELEKQRKESDYYRNLYETTKTQFDQMKSQYTALLKETNKNASKNHELPALPVNGATDQPTESTNQITAKQINEKSTIERRSRSRSRSRNRSRGRKLRPRPNKSSRDSSAKRSRTRGQSAKRSRSKGRSPHQTSKQTCSSIVDSGNKSSKAKVDKQQSESNKSDSFIMPKDPFESSKDDDSTMQN